MNPYKQTEDRIRQTKPELKTPVSMDSRILLDSYASMPSLDAPAEQPGRSMIRRILMKNTIKLTAAAAAMIGISLFFLFNMGGSTIALAAVYAKVQQAQAYRYTMNMTMTGKGELMGQPDVQGPV